MNGWPFNWGALALFYKGVPFYQSGGVSFYQNTGCRFTISRGNRTISMGRHSLYKSTK